MTKVKFLQSISTVDNSYQVNQVTPLNPTLATSWIKAGVCVSLEPSKSAAELKAEKAAADAVKAKQAENEKAAALAAAAKKKVDEEAQYQKDLAALEAEEAKKTGTPAAVDENLN